MKFDQIIRSWHPAVQFLFGLATLAFLTLVCSLLGRNLATTAFAYLILIVFLCLVSSFFPLVALSIIAVGCLNYIFAPQSPNLHIDYSEDGLAIAAFLITTLVVTGLVQRARTLAQTAIDAQSSLQADIISRTRVEDALRQSEAYLAETQRLSQTGSWAWDPTNGEIRYWSEETYRLLGFDPDGAPPRFETFFQRVHCDDQAETRELLKRATDERTDFELDFRIVHPSSSIRGVHVVGHPVFGPSGEFAEFVGTVIDVTERKRAEEERQSHLWFLECMDKINRAIQGTNDLEQMMSDVLGVVLSIFACDRAWLVYPCEPEAPSWRVAMEHTRPNYPGAVALRVDLPMDAVVANVFRTARASSGAVRFDRQAAYPVPAHLAERFGIQSLIGMPVYPKVDRPYMFGLHQCSHPRVWTPQEQRLFLEIGRRLGDALTSLLMLRNLRESESKLEEAQRLAHVGHWDLDFDTDRFSWSDETYRIFGLRPCAGTITTPLLRELIHLEDWEGMTKARADAQRDGGLPYDLEYRVVRPDGDVRIVHSRGTVIKDQSGRPRRMFGTVQDITARKQAEVDLRESERRYRETQTELAHANRVTTMGQLTASIAHEVNQPIAAAVTNADAGLRWLNARSPDLEEVRQSLERIVKAGHQASDVISRIRALIKKAPARKVALDINETVVETVALTRNELARNSIWLQTELANGLPRIQGDRVQLQQVILNLVVNAIEAISEVGDGSRELLIRTCEDTHSVLVTVQDSGPGLKPEHLDRLFNAFYTTKPAGMGMGLSICRSIIEAHGGRLWAKSNVPRGAVFQFTLPLDQDDAT